MTHGPLLVVSPDGAQLSGIAETIQRSFAETPTHPLDAHTTTLREGNIYFLWLPSGRECPPVLASADRFGASIITVGTCGELPNEVETFRLQADEGPAVVPLLRALMRRETTAFSARRVYDAAVAAISRELIQETVNLTRALATLGSALAVDRMTLFQLCPDGLSGYATHEWCGAGVAPLIRVQAAMDKRTLLWLLPRIEAEHLLRMDDVAALPFSDLAERALASKRGVRSVLMAPLRAPDGTLRGALLAEHTGSAHVWNVDQERLLLTTGEILANYLERQIASAAASDAESLHRQVLEHLHDGLFVVSAEGSRPIYVNPAAARIWGMSQEYLASAPYVWTQVVHPEDRDHVMAVERINRTEPGVHERALEYRILRADDGCERWIRARTFHMTNAEGDVDRIAGLVEDVTEQRTQVARLRLLAQVFEATGEAVVVTDSDARIVDVNSAFTRITGYALREVYGKNPNFMASGRHDCTFYTAMWEALKTQRRWHGEIWDRRKDGAQYPKLLTIDAIADERGTVTHYVGVFSDITDVKETELRLQRIAHHDPLTGLPNRLLFRDRLEQAVAQALRSRWLLGLMFIDLDGFKEVNDTLGHRAGDLLLTEVATRLGAEMRDSDTLARIGGDEFTVIVNQLKDHTGAESVARKLLQVLRKPFDIAGKQVQVSASIGISLFPDMAADVDELLRTADVAMYRSKESGRNRFCFAQVGGERRAV